MNWVVPRLFFLAVLIGSGVVSGAALAGEPPQGIAWTARHADPRFGSYVSSPWGFLTNTYWIAGPAGVVLVDTQFLPSAATEAMAAAEQATGKRVTDAVVLHVNPDKFNGTAALQKRGVRVVTSAHVAAEIPAVHALRSSWFGERYAPDYPTELPVPATFGATTQDVVLGGLTMRAHLFGLACSKAHVVLQLEDHVFVGDLVSPGNHAWMELGALTAWIGVLRDIAALKPQFVHPGRGPSGGPELIDQQISYLQTVQRLVSAARPRKKDDTAGIARVHKQMLAAYPSHDFAVFLGLGLPAVWNAAVTK